MGTRSPSPLRIAANRRNALKSTGPKTPAGKRRVALNRLRRTLCPEELAQQLRARGESPREFCRLHRDLVAIFKPEGDVAAERAVEWLARTWWDKWRRMRQWVAAGPVRCSDLDARLEELLVFLVNLLRLRHEPWRRRLMAILGRPGSPAEVRRGIEPRLFIFGGKPGRRKYYERKYRSSVLEEFERAFADMLGRTSSGAAAGPTATAHEANKANQTQTA